MADKIVVDPAKLEAASGKVTEYAGDYQKTYTQLFTEVEAMAANWSGTDNIAYTTQIKGFQDDFEKMYKMMTDYAEFLKTSATKYKTTQANVESGAKKLTN